MLAGIKVSDLANIITAVATSLTFLFTILIWLYGVRKRHIPDFKYDIDKINSYNLDKKMVIITITMSPALSPYYVFKVISNSNMYLVGIFTEDEMYDRRIDYIDGRSARYGDMGRTYTIAKDFFVSSLMSKHPEGSHISFVISEEELDRCFNISFRCRSESFPWRWTSKISIPKTTAFSS